jgi:ribosomal protein S4
MLIKTSGNFKPLVKEGNFKNLISNSFKLRKNASIYKRNSGKFYKNRSNIKNKRKGSLRFPIVINFKNYRIFDSIIIRRAKIVRRLGKLNLLTYHSLLKNYPSFKWLGDIFLVSGLSKYRRELESLESRGLKRKLIRRRLKVYAIALFDKQKLKGYHIGLKEYMLKNIIKSVFSNKYNPLQQFMNLLESRLISFLFRTNYFKSMIQLKIFLKLGYVYVNGKNVTSPNYFLSIGDLVTFKYVSRNKKLFFKNFKKRFSLFYYPSRYMEISFPLMVFQYYRRPFPTDVLYPFSINLSRILYYYNYRGLR